MHKKTEDFVEEEDETSSEDDSEESGRKGKDKGLRKVVIEGMACQLPSS